VITETASNRARAADRPLKGAWTMLILLTLTATLAYVDRQMFNLFAQSIKQDLGLSDTALGMLQGLAFSLFYGVMSFPIARMADTYNRRSIIRLAVLFWSAMTVATAFSKSFISMFLVRAGTASGEAGLSPSAAAMIADMFPRSKIPLPISLYSFSIYFGSGVGFALGAIIQSAFGGSSLVNVPILGETTVWRVAFFAAGLFGLPWAVIALKWLKEPKRAEYSKSGAVVESSAEKASLSDVFTFLKKKGAFFISFVVGFTLILGAANAVFSWTPAILIRVFGKSVSDVGYIFGMLFVFCGIGGALTSGLVANSKFIASKKGGILWLAMVCALGLVLSQFMALVSDTSTTYLIFTGSSIFFIAPCISLPPAVLQTIAPSNMRAQMIALFLMVTGALGLGTGPIIVGIMTDYVFADPMKLHTAVAASTFALCGLGLPLVLFSRLRYWVKPAK